MKQLITLTVAIILFSVNAWAQCTPNSPTGSPGLTPVTDSLACVEIGNPYSEVVFLENFDNFSATVPIIGQITITVDSLRIDSITNIPCGLTWAANKPSRTYYSGETGCIAVSGNSFENVGQYRLNIYVHVWATAPFPIGAQDFQGEASDVVGQVESLTGQSLGVDFDYYLRVINAGDPCPNIDRVDPNANLTASASCAPTGFTATISGNTEVCNSETTTLTVSFINGTAPYTILWSSGSTATDITVSAGTYGVTAIDNNGDTATTSITVTSNSSPVSGFTVTVLGDSVVVVYNGSGNVTSGSYDFGGQGTITTPEGSFVFSANGTYTITQIVNNDCGSDTSTQDVTINVIGINELGSTLSAVQVSPNPSNGSFNLKLVALENSPVSVKIYNLQGQQVYASSFDAVAGQASSQAIELNNAASGIYIIQIQANDALVTQKLMVK